jgi:hypothetical protein
VPKRPVPSVFQLLVTLEGVDPTVWRRLLVPGGVGLDKLNLMFQAAMGWTNSHLHIFTIKGQDFGMHDEDAPEDEIDEREVTVADALGDVRRFSYEYDLGDSWEHEVVVEAVERLPQGLRVAVCLDGANACPPEDCGGPHGYAELLEALADPRHEEHQRFTEWVGGSFDPTSFDLLATNAALQHLR